MRCKACDVILDDTETVKKDSSGVYYDLCTDCLTVSIATHWELENMESIDIDGNKVWGFASMVDYFKHKEK